MERFSLLSLRELAQILPVDVIEQVLREFTVCTHLCDEGLSRDVQNFLHMKAISWEEDTDSATYLLLDQDRPKGSMGIKIAAFLTISINIIDLSWLPVEERKELQGDHLKGQKVASAYLISQLGRDSNYAHDVLSGESIMQACFDVINEVRRRVGGRIIMLECTPRLFKKVYQDFGFTMVELEDSEIESEFITVFQSAYPKKLELGVE